MSQERIQKPKQTQQEKQDEAKALAEKDAARQAADAKQADLTATDELLDEIDALLEENAEEFVKGYVQKGGQ